MLMFVQGVAIGGGIGSIHDILEAAHFVNKQVCFLA